MLLAAADQAQKAGEAAQPASAWAEFWKAVPGLIWPFLLAGLFVAYRREVRAILSNVVYRLRSGGALKIWTVEVGAVSAVRDNNVTPEEKMHGVRQDDGDRGRERTAYYTRARDAMLVHTLARSRDEGMLYDVLIYL